MKRSKCFLEKNDKLIKILLPIIFFIFTYIFFYICERSWRGNLLSTLKQFFLDMQILFQTGDFLPNFSSTIMSLFGLIIVILLILRIFVKNHKINIALTISTLIFLFLFYILIFFNKPQMLITDGLIELIAKFFWSLRKFYFITQYLIPPLIIFILALQLNSQIQDYKDYVYKTNHVSKSPTLLSKKYFKIFIYFLLVISIILMLLFL